MYNGMDKKREFIWQPPQGEANVFMAMNQTQCPLTLSAATRKYIQSVRRYQGGDCKLWCRMIARDMVENQITSHEWMKRFREENECTGEGYDPDISQQNGLRIVQYMSKAIVRYLSECKRGRAKARTHTELNFLPPDAAPPKKTQTSLVRVAASITDSSKPRRVAAEILEEVRSFLFPGSGAA